MRVSKFSVAAIYAVASVVAVTDPAYAVDASLDAAYEGKEAIVVTGTSEGYAATDTATATKTDTPLIDVPQTVNVITREQLDDQAMHSIGEVLRYVPGITVGQGEGNRDQITMRGQNSTADFFIDGVRDDVQYYRGLYNIERVEVLKGPFALIFGRGGGGGIINRVQKAPIADEQIYAVEGSANSFDAYEVSGDINLPIANGAAARVNANYARIDNHRDFVGGERVALNPYVAAKIGADWKLGLSYEYLRDDRVADRGIPSLASRPITGFEQQFFGVPGVNRSVIEAHIGKLRFEGTPADNVKVFSTLLYGEYDKIYTNVYANGAATAQNGTVALAGYSDPTKRQNFLAQAHLQWDIATGAIDHKFLFGMEYGDQRSANRRINATLSNTLFNLVTPVFPTVTFNAPARDTVSNVRFLSAYAQDQIKLGEYIELVGGVRFDRFSIKGSDLFPAIDRPFARTDELLSPRLGIIVKPQENLSLYVSYSESFLPRSGDQFLSLTVTQQNLAPEKFTNREAGIKWDVNAGLSLTLAAFQLDRSNATTPDPANPLLSINIGSTRTKGVEFSVAGRLTSFWQISGGAALQGGHLLGNDLVKLSQLPRVQVSLWNRFDLVPNFGVGIGVVHQSSAYAAIRTSAVTTLLPAFTRMDAALFYNMTEKFKLQLNVENMLDARYFSDAHNNNNITPGAPVNARLTAKLRF
jgi:catecholate siderophore receptor